MLAFDVIVNGHITGVNIITCDWLWRATSTKILLKKLEGDLFFYQKINREEYAGWTKGEIGGCVG